MLMKDRTHRKVITHRIAAGRPNNPTIVSGHGKWLHSLDYFELTGVEQDPVTLQFAVDKLAMDRLPSFGEQYSATKPRRIPIRLASDLLEDSLTQAYRSRAMLPVIGADGNPKMGMRQGDTEASPIMRLQPWCEGDGQTARRLTGGGERVSIPCHASPKCGERPLPQLLELLGKKAKHDPVVDTLRCPWAQNASVGGLKDAPPIAKKAPTCKPETVLICHCDAIGGVGSFARFRSHGHYTADNLRSSLEEIQKQLGFLAGVPLDLVMMMVRIPAPGGGAGKLQPVVHAELRIGAEETIRLMEHNLNARLAITAGSKQLAAARLEAEEAIDAEFTAPLTAGNDGGGSIKG